MFFFQHCTRQGGESERERESERDREQVENVNCSALSEIDGWHDVHMEAILPNAVFAVPVAASDSPPPRCRPLPPAEGISGRLERFSRSEFTGEFTV